VGRWVCVVWKNLAIHDTFRVTRAVVLKESWTRNGLFLLVAKLEEDGGSCERKGWIRECFVSFHVWPLVAYWRHSAAGALTLTPLRVPRLEARVRIESGHVVGDAGRIPLSSQWELVIPGHGVEGLRQVRCPLEYNFLGEFLRVTRMSGYKFLESLESIVNRGFTEG